MINQVFKEQTNANNNNREKDDIDEDKSDESKAAQKFDAIAKHMKNV